jgi:hypothetical protein
METPVQPGDVLLGKYRVEHVLGQGGMGLVLAARHLDLGELFAIKLLLPEALGDPDAADRFLREARAAARLKGEHVVRVQDVGRLPSGAPYMVMEHLMGSNLKELIRTRGPLPVDQAVTYVLEACDAIAEAHALGIVHRDLKPANLFLLQRPNGTHCVKVLDFGISKQQAPGGVELTKSGMLLGSPLYMSPEQMLRTKSVDARSDLWALGVVLYELATGALPFQAETVTEIIALVLQEEPSPPSQVRPGLPAALDAVVMRCLQKRPDQRFQSIAELMAALRPLVATAGVWANAAALPPLAPRPAFVSQPEVPQVPQLDPAIAGAALTASAWGRTGGARRAPRAGRKAIALACVAAGSAALAGAAIWLALRGSPQPAVSSEAASPLETGRAAGALAAPPSLAPSGPAPEPSAPTGPHAAEPAVAAAHEGSAAPALSSSGASTVPSHAAGDSAAAVSARLAERPGVSTSAPAPSPPRPTAKPAATNTPAAGPSRPTPMPSPTKKREPIL